MLSLFHEPPSPRGCILLLAVFVASASPVVATDLRGRLVSDGQPLAGVSVSALAAETRAAEARREAREDPPPRALVTTTSTADGSFSLALPASLGSATTWLRVEVTGAAVSPRRLVGIFAPGDDQDLGELELPRALRLAGRVFDERGRPLAGARLTLWSGYTGGRAGHGHETLAVTARSAADGSFHIDGAAADSNRLRVEAPGRAEPRSSCSTFRPGASRSRCAWNPAGC